MPRQECIGLRSDWRSHQAGEGLLGTTLSPSLASVLPAPVVMLFRLLIAAVLFNTATPVIAQDNPFGLRTEPAVPIAGEPFDVVATSGPCTLLIVGRPFGGFGFSYGGVSATDATVEARWGGINVLPCDAPITEVRQTFQRLAAGRYELQFILQSVPAPPNRPANETVVTTFELYVASGRGVHIPAASASLLLAFALFAALLGWLSIRRNAWT